MNAIPEHACYLINVAFAVGFAKLFNLRLVELNTEFGHLLYWRRQ